MGSGALGTASCEGRRSSCSVSLFCLVRNGLLTPCFCPRVCRVPVTRAANKHACRLASVMWLAEKGLSNPDVLTAEFREQERERTSERIRERGWEGERDREITALGEPVGCMGKATFGNNGHCWKAVYCCRSLRDQPVTFCSQSCPTYSPPLGSS